LGALKSCVDEVKRLGYVTGISGTTSSTLGAMDTAAAHLHRYIYFYQSDTQLAFAATTSGSALVIDRATAKLSLQGSPAPEYAFYSSAEHIVVSTFTDRLRDSRDDQTSIGYFLDSSM